jgi:hypothetical protein
MKALLAALGEEASKRIQRPAEPRVVMEEFCRAMSVRKGRPITLLFRPFPAGVPVWGLRMDCGDRSFIVVEETTVPEAQLVILGHELWHEEQGHCGHGAAGLSAAARALTADLATERVRRIAEQILVAQEVPREAFLAAAARADVSDEHEVEAETFGLWFGREVRTWMVGRYAKGPTNPATIEGRIDLSMSSRGGLLP